ncbi:MAG: hypothetical protein KJ950_05995 [Proteobacteria bacterium]|nr:hypothetical protein [Pseudomonadota bacterium]MBU1688736.1 hypothetical protein [Pseudomonadota bacterium]
MIANIKTNTAANLSSETGIDTITRLSLFSMATVSGLVGIWSTACLISVMLSNGPSTVVSGFVSALVG